MDEKKKSKSVARYLFVVGTCLCFGCSGKKETGNIGASTDASHSMDTGASEPVSVGLEKGKPTEPIEGMVFTITLLSHKHMVGGGTTGFWELEIQKGDEKFSTRTETTDERGSKKSYVPSWDYIEGKAFGRVYSLMPTYPFDMENNEPPPVIEDQRSFYKVVTVYPKSTKTTVSDFSEVLDLVQKKAKDFGCEGSGWLSHDLSWGSVAMVQTPKDDGPAENLCEAVVGQYTDTVFIRKVRSSSDVDDEEEQDQEHKIERRGEVHFAFANKGQTSEERKAFRAERKSIRRFFKQRKPMIRSCYQRYLKRHQPWEGKVSCEFDIGQSGRVNWIEAQEGPSEVALLNECVVSMLKRMRFPPREKGGTLFCSVTVSFTAKPIKSTKRRRTPSSNH